ncbi:MAG: PaaI family thioesterase [Actinomycetota bacterium]
MTGADGEAERTAAEEAAVQRLIRTLYPAASVDGLRATAWFEPQPEHRGNPGWLQGGLAATVLDHLCARAASAALGDRVVTGTLELRYPRPVPIADGPFRVWAEAQEARGRMTRARGAIVDADGRPMVEAKGLFLLRPG